MSRKLLLDNRRSGRVALELDDAGVVTAAEGPKPAGYIGLTERRARELHRYGVITDYKHRGDDRAGEAHAARYPSSARKNGDEPAPEIKIGSRVHVPGWGKSGRVQHIRHDSNTHEVSQIKVQFDDGSPPKYHSPENVVLERTRKNPGDEPALKWTPHVDGKVFGSSGKVTLSSGRVVEVSLRVDAREEDNVRVDKATTGPWNAIDDGEGFSTVSEAQRFAKAWLRAAQAENTLDPRVPRNIRDMGPLEGVFTRENPDASKRKERKDKGTRWVSCEEWCESSFAIPAGQPLVLPEHSARDAAGVRIRCPGSGTPVPRKNPGFSSHGDDTVSSLDDSCTRQYLETAMWASTDDNDVPLDKEFSITDFAPSEVEKARKACADFCDNNDVSEIENDQVGHYLWLSRNGHGAGFFDINRDDLQEAARKLGEVAITVGDDGLLYFSR